MGVVKGVGADEYPEQFLYTRVRVVFGYNSTLTFPGEVIRDDKTEPGRTIIRLDDGRVVLGTECMWSPVA